MVLVLGWVGDEAGRVLLLLPALGCEGFVRFRLRFGNPRLCAEVRFWESIVVMAEVEAKPISLKELKDASTDLSDAAQLTMREIIKRAEAIERRVRGAETMPWRIVLVCFIAVKE